MSANRRFFANGADNPVFIFTIDTTKTVTGATDGSENPLTFRLPISIPNNSNNFIIRVSDGRADVTYVPNVNGMVLTFATSGVYTITLIGKVLYFRPQSTDVGYDKLKWIEVNRWGNVQFGAGSNEWNNAFNGCSNLTIKAKNGLKIPNSARSLFEGIKGFESTVDLNKYDTSETLNVGRMFKGITMPFYSVLNPFFNVATSQGELYEGNDMSNVSKIEVLSPTITNVRSMLKDSSFQGELIIKAPLTDVYGLLENVYNPPSLGKVDIRYVVINSNWLRFINNTMSKVNVDSTLKGWVTNFDWSGIANRTVTVNFRNSVYSNNPEVIAAKTFLESKGFTFTNLTMEI